jgi:acyl dehydratase
MDAATEKRPDAMTTDQLKAAVGREIGVSDWVLVDQQRIDRFADVTEDHQFIHVDKEAAARTPFGTTIAHGYLTLSLLSLMAYQVMPPVTGATMAVNYGLNSLRFLSPVPSGSRVRGRFTLKDFVERSPGQFQTTVDVAVEIENIAKPALVAEWVTLTFVSQ